MTMSNASIEGVILPTPEPMMKGTYAVYALPDGGRVIAYRAEGTEESAQIPIPAFMIKMWERQAAGEKINPMEMIRAMMRGQD